MRLAGLASVVAGHTWTQYPVNGYVSIFFVLAGYLWSARRTVAEDIRYQSWKLLVPYFAWLGILAVPYFARLMLGHQKVPDLGGRALDLLWCGERGIAPFTAFWFMTALYVGTVLFRILMKAPRWVDSAPHMIKFVAAWVFPISVAWVLLRFPDSVARRTLMPDKDHHLL